MSANVESMGRAPGTMHAVGAPGSDLMTSDVNLLSPENLISFFELKIQACRTNVQKLMSDQDARTKRAGVLDKAAAMLTAYDKNVGEKDGNYAQFRADLEAAIKELGPDTPEGKKLQAMLDKCTPAVKETFQRPADDAKIADWQKAHPNGMTTQPGGSLTVTCTDGGGAVDVVDIKKAKEEFSSTAGTLKSEMQMGMVRMQQAIDQVTQFTNVCSNILRKVDEATMAPIHNMK